MNLVIEKDNIPDIKDQAKQLAVDALSASDINSLLKFSFIHPHAELLFGKDPCYRHSIIDEDFYAFIKQAVLSHPLKEWVEENRYVNAYDRPCKLKVGVVLEGFSSTQAPIQRYRTLAKFYDKSKFSLHFYSRLSGDFRNFKTEKYDLVIDELVSSGCHVSFPNHDFSPIKEIEFLAKSIVSDEIDILFFQTVYFVPQFNFLSCLHTTPFQAGGSHQQPELSRELDCVDSPKSFLPYQVTDCIPLFAPMNMDDSLPAYDRKEFGIPADAVIMISSNRAIKYHNEANKGFWKGIEAVLERHKNVWFIPLGLENGEFSHERILKLGFRTDAVQFYKMSDIYVDIWTHTSRGVMEAGYVGVPSITFHRRGQPFSVLNQDLTEDFTPHTALVVRDPEEWHYVLDRLILDTEYRKQMGEVCYTFTRKFEPKKSVNLFLSALEDRFWRKVRNGM